MGVRIIGRQRPLGGHSRAPTRVWSTSGVFVLVSHWRVISIHVLILVFFLLFFFFSASGHLLLLRCLRFISQSSNVSIGHHLGRTRQRSLHTGSIFGSGAFSVGASAISEQKFSAMACSTGQALSRWRTCIVLPGVVSKVKSIMHLTVWRAYVGGASI